MMSRQSGDASAETGCESLTGGGQKGSPTLQRPASAAHRERPAIRRSSVPCRPLERANSPRAEATGKGGKKRVTINDNLQIQAAADRRPSFSIAKIPENMSKAKLKEFREAFRLFDKDGDGSITKEELGRVMRSLGQFAREEELQQMLHDVDIDGDGCFSFEEFVEIVSNMGNTSENTKEEEEKELRDAFRVFDKHNRGYISASDLRAVLQCLGEDLSEEEIEDMIKEVDVDGDGRIDFLEFVHALGEPGEDEENDENDDDGEDNSIKQ